MTRNEPAWTDRTTLGTDRDFPGLAQLGSERVGHEVRVVDVEVLRRLECEYDCEYHCARTDDSGTTIASYTRIFATTTALAAAAAAAAAADIISAHGYISAMITACIAFSIFL